MFYVTRSGQGTNPGAQYPLAPCERRKQSFQVEVRAGTTVDSLLRRLGIPPDEVDVVLVDGESVDTTYPLHAEARLAVYPTFESFDVIERFQLDSE